MNLEVANNNPDIKTIKDNTLLELAKEKSPPL